MKQKTTRGTNFSDFELDIIRLGISLGRNQAQIAWFLGRSEMAVSRRVRAMREDGTLDELPWTHTAIQDIRREGQSNDDE